MRHGRRTIQWPGSALMCVTFTVAYEAFVKTGRFKASSELDVNLCSLSHAEYGGNQGVWRMLEIFERRGVKANLHTNGLAAEKWPDTVKAAHDAGHEIAAHGWTNEVGMARLTPEQQRENIQACTRVIQEVTGQRPVGWVSPGLYYTWETPAILVEEGYKWFGDPSSEDLPYVVSIDGQPLVIIPKMWYANDWRAWEGGLGSLDNYYEGFKQTFDFMYQEALRGRPGRIDALVHAELGGRPHIASAFERIIRYVKGFGDEVWIPRRRDIADHCLSIARQTEEWRDRL